MASEAQSDQKPAILTDQEASDLFREVATNTRFAMYFAAGILGLLFGILISGGFNR